MIRARPMTRLFALYAAIMLVPVLILGAVLAKSYRVEADQRGLAEGRSAALLVAHTGVQPILDGRPLSAGLSPAESAWLGRLSAAAAQDHSVLRLRVRDLAGRVVYPPEHGTQAEAPDDGASAAAHGQVVAELTHLNSDPNDFGRQGVKAIEVYLPLRAGQPAHQVGVLELYLPYAPIDSDINSGLGSLYRNLAIGLALLYLAFFLISVSVTRRLRQQVRLNVYQAEHDSLTDLSNRERFQQNAQDEINKALTANTRVAIAIIDLDRFKEINYTLGHRNGDRVLTALAHRLAVHVPNQDKKAIARLGGDEFGLILTAVDDFEETLSELRTLIGRDVNVSGFPLSVESSIGFVVAPDDGSDVGELMQRADVAMYEAKARHAGVLRYDPAQNHYDAENLALIVELRLAIEANQLVLHYQPKATLADGTIQAVEALVRWQHPNRGLLPPDKFIPLAEQTDLIDKLTAWVIRQALTDLRAVSSSGPPISVAVNVSARNLGQPGFAGQVVDILSDVGVAANRLTVEVTETALLTDPDRAALVLAELDDAGVHVSLDDFGRGQTSLGYLSTLPVDELKVDRSFVFDMLENPAHAAIVRSIIDLGHNLGLRVVAEGVETDEVLAFLMLSGCDLAQGYYLARPMPLKALRDWLARVPALDPIG
jgi:diguanylate cyclase